VSYGWQAKRRLSTEARQGSHASEGGPKRRWAGSDGDVSYGWQANLRKKVSKS